MTKLNTTQLRKEWAPACTGPFAKVGLHGEGVITVRADIVDAVRALNNVLIKYDYRTRKADTGAFVCRAITGGTGYSLHAYGIAIDINWQSNPYGKKLITDMPIAMVNEIKAIRTKSGAQVWGWGGDYGTNKDAMHFEIVCTRADIASGIVTKTPVKPPPAPKEEDNMEYKDWSDTSKKMFIADLRKALLYDITGSQPANPDKGPWTNLGDVINAINAK